LLKDNPYFWTNDHGLMRTQKGILHFSFIIFSGLGKREIAFGIEIREEKKKERDGRMR